MLKSQLIFYFSTEQTRTLYGFNLFFHNFLLKNAFKFWKSEQLELNLFYKTIDPNGWKRKCTVDCKKVGSRKNNFLIFSEECFPHFIVWELRTLLRKYCKHGLQRNDWKKKKSLLKRSITIVFILDILKSYGFIIIWWGLPCCV